VLVMVHYGVHNGKGIFNIVDYENRRYITEYIMEKEYSI